LKKRPRREFHGGRFQPARFFGTGDWTAPLSDEHQIADKKSDGAHRDVDEPQPEQAQYNSAIRRFETRDER
jgi:hypothetical protein